MCIERRGRRVWFSDALLRMKVMCFEVVERKVEEVDHLACV